VPNPHTSLSLFTRDDARYWKARPADHNEAGLFVHGPQEAIPPTSRLAQSNLYEWTPETPTVAHSRMIIDRARRRMLLERRRSFLESIRGAA
jgi:hypothetical protein